MRMGGFLIKREGKILENKEDIIIKCIGCGAEFTFTYSEQKNYELRGFTAPKRCKKCRKARRAEIESKKRAEADLIWYRQEEQKINRLLAELPYSRISTQDVHIFEPGKTLYVIGNGFDIVHGVPSRYSDFRDSMGRNNDLRWRLETFLKTDSLWSDFEEALAHIDGSAMLGTVDMWMDIMGAYEPDAQMADMCIAYEAATDSALEITRALPKKFRKWVETLKSTKEPMWNNILHPAGLYLNFNYTEFVETLYGVAAQRVTYIHGCRKNKKQELILGHAPGAGDNDDWTPTIPVPKYKSRRKRELLDAAMESAAYNLTWYDNETTKKTDEIIANHQEFFDKSADATMIVVLGHSLSVVDYPYFREIIKQNRNKAKWLISWHGLRDLENIKAFAAEMGIEAKKITIMK